ncbi:hypothetical protein JTE90_009536 [Oedothorax gibbosus]|uniref:Uncharacterized protein n=1 Tax=Oedothorax gibbosus TaxID=931172 RepID=A0AAV6UT20_9ARAC|nr:hypothetical protein JTE90_009536 [Oedothorax gibbosus]
MRCTTQAHIKGPLSRSEVLFCKEAASNKSGTFAADLGNCRPLNWRPELHPPSGQTRAASSLADLVMLDNGKNRFLIARKIFPDFPIRRAF